MKALSIWQPWASAIAVGVKRFETRGWSTPHCGLLAIHAAKRCTEAEREDFNELIEDSLASRLAFGDALSLDFDTLPFGQVVAVGELSRCLPTEECEPSALEQLWGNFSGGRYGWEFARVWRLAQPVPWRGLQSLFDVELPADWQAKSVEVAQVAPF